MATKKTTAKRAASAKKTTKRSSKKKTVKKPAPRKAAVRTTAPDKAPNKNGAKKKVAGKKRSSATRRSEPAGSPAGPRDAATVAEYLSALPEDRRAALEAVRAVILKNLGDGLEEGMQYGMIGYFVPHAVYPPGYHCDPTQPVPFAGLASQKNHMSIYLMCLYGDEAQQAWFREAWAKTGKKLDMGKSCIRFKKVEDLPLSVIGRAVKRATLKRFLAHYEGSVKSAGKRARS